MISECISYYVTYTIRWKFFTAYDFSKGKGKFLIKFEKMIFPARGLKPKPLIPKPRIYLAAPGFDQRTGCQILSIAGTGQAQQRQHCKHRIFSRETLLCQHGCRIIHLLQHCRVRTCPRWGLRSQFSRGNSFIAA